jgi:hypothetical protein
VTGSWQQESVYIAVAAYELVVLRLIWKRVEPSARGVRNYLKAQLSMFCFLFPMSIFSGCQFYFSAYAAASALNLAAELGVLAGMFADLNGGTCAFGSLSLWFSLCLTVTIGLAAVLLITPPPFREPVRIYLALDQVGTIIRNVGLFAIVAYGWLCGTSWPPRISFIWLGMAIYSLMDFACQRLQLLQSFAFPQSVQYGPTAGSIVMFTLWAVALSKAAHRTFLAPPEKQLL